jgi:hypothetical protein
MRAIHLLPVCFTLSCHVKDDSCDYCPQPEPVPRGEFVDNHPDDFPWVRDLEAHFEGDYLRIRYTDENDVRWDVTYVVTAESSDPR